MEEHLRILVMLPCWAGAITTTPLQGGRTNDNYVVRDTQGVYVARFAPASNKHLGLERAREIHNCTIAAVAQIASKILVYYEEYDVLIVEFFDGGILSPEYAQRPEIIQKMAKTLSKLHSLQGFEGHFDALKDAEANILKAKNANAWLPSDFDSLFSIVKERAADLRPIAPVACHFDLMLENIIVGEDAVPKLIDWEYSSMGDWRFDLAMYFAKAKLNDTQVGQFLEAYGAEDSKTFRSELATQKALMHLSIATYGILQNAVSDKVGEVNYKSYAESELKELASLIEKL